MSAPQSCIMSGPYKMFFDYLENRFANALVLTFGQIKDLRRSALPARALGDQKWWTDAQVNLDESQRSDGVGCSPAEAAPNTGARIVKFTREL
jgi:hypothetical protein